MIEWNEQNKYTNTWINKWKLRGGRKKPKIGKQIIWIPSDPPSLLGRFRITLAASGKRKKLDLLTSRAFERERAKVRAGSYHTRPENQANDFEKV